MDSKKKINYKKPKEKVQNWRKIKQKWKKVKEAKLIDEVKKDEKKENPSKKLKVDDESSVPVTEDNQKTTETVSGRHYTISLALPGSILENAQSPELRTYLAGQIARAAAIYQIDEVVVFDEDARLTQKEFEAATSGHDESSSASKYNCNVQLAKILEYLECPQYLRKHLFPLQKDLQYAGLLNPLDCLHHFRSDDLTIPYREGITLKKPTRDEQGSFCNIGLSREVQIDKQIQENVRVTVKLTTFDLSKKKLKGIVVSPNEPVKLHGFYWGYTVRLARSIGSVFSECPHVDGYDLTIGTSEKGQNVDEIKKFPKFKHLLIVFGGVKGLESCVDNDQTLTVDDPKELFKFYLDTCPDQGSRTIRTEEAILISLSVLRPKLVRSQQKDEKI